MSYQYKHWAEDLKIGDTVIYSPFEDIDCLDEAVTVLQVMPRFSKIVAGLEDGSAIQIPFYRLKK